MRVGVITLGCDKNTVDSERYLAELSQYGAEATRDLSRADLIIVNTCGFVDAAKAESVEAMIEAGRYKTEGQCRAVVAVGCMVQRHRDELAAELPEIDLFLGTSDVDRLLPELASRGLLADAVHLVPGERIYAGDVPHVRYLKVSEGCDHGCAFCAIPLMRGRHRSFATADVVREAQLLELQGAREINLVAQDLAHFGRDRRDGIGLTELLRLLLSETSVPWFRLLYVYSAGLTPSLLELMATEPRIVPYLDIPMQHASDEVLRRMRRPERRVTQRARLAAIREAVPDIALRTTCIVGFPGETDADFSTLLEFLEEVQFDRVGAFAYSAQEGTRAFTLPDDVPDVVKRERLERFNEVQRLITGERYEARVGAIVGAMILRRVGDGNLLQARTAWQADDVDGVAWVRSNTTRPELGSGLVPGAMVDVHIDGVIDDYDFAASVVRVADSPRPLARRTRALPLARTSAGSFGR